MRPLGHRIVLTENCNASCEHCFNADSRDGAVMDVDKIIEFIKQNKKHTMKEQLKIMGGEPTTHPRCEELIKVACEHYRLVTLFTNGLTMDKITNIPNCKENHFKRKLEYIINGHTFNLEKFDSYKDNVITVGLHFVFTLNGTDKIVEKALKCAKVMKKQIYVKYSSDTQINLFDDKICDQYRKVWTKGIFTLLPILREMDVSYSFDHSLPMCFFTSDMIEELDRAGLPNINFDIGCCSCLNLGLIDTNFDLWYCNQTKIKMGSTLKKDGTFKSMDEIVEMVASGPKKKTDSIAMLSDKCRSCTALPTCRAGCYYNTLLKSESA